MNQTNNFTFLKLLSLLITILLFNSYGMAQLPAAKVDINMEGRSTTEVNEPGYTPWYIPRVSSDTLVVSDVTFIIKATAPKDHTTMRCSWSKALVQSPYYMRLVNDGVKIDNDSLLAYPDMGAEIELHIQGLPVGSHSIQTYHNLWQDTSKTNRSPINVYLNDELIHENIYRSMKVENKSEATVLLTLLNITEAGQEMVLKMEAVKEFDINPAKPTDINVCINGFELNTSDLTKESREPIPVDGDMHVDADNGSVELQWQASLNNLTQTHTLFVGTDSATVANATKWNADVCKGNYPVTTTTYELSGLYSMNTYYWRVDETDSEGQVTKGKIWHFRPRHLAFPDAEGYGRFAIGGRGGQVVYVTNLDDSGPGSFRNAVENYNGPRTILFAVSGLITLNSRLVINDDFITVAGQTAPGKGICFRWAPVGVIGDDLIVQHLRVRLGIGITYDGMGLTGADHSIVDHCSISWTIDEAFSSRGAHNITLQRTLISEALNEAGHSNYSAGKRHGFAASIGGDVGSFHHNLLAHCAGRNWSLAGGLDGDGYYSGRLDITNNIVYNWDGRTTDGGAHEVNFVNNFYKKGAAVDNVMMLTAQLEGVGKGSQSYFYEGNVLQNLDGSFACDGTDNTCARNYQKASTQILDWELWVDEPFFPSFVNTESATDAFKKVLSNVGCTQPVFDNHDIRMVEETLHGTYSCNGSKTNKPGLPDHEDDVNAWEAYPGYTRSADWDSDLDGLPNWWETARQTNPNSAAGSFADSNADNDMNGYTNLEEYLHWMSKPHYFMNTGESLTINLSDYTRGFTNNPVFSVFNAENGVASLTGNSMVNFTPSAEGMAGFEFTVVDADGTEMTQKIGVFTGSIPGNEAFEYLYFKDRALTEEVIVGKNTASNELKNQWENLQLSVYPNPANNTLNVIIGSNNQSMATITISDISGNIIKTEQSYISKSNDLMTIDLTNLASGVYFINARNSDSTKSVKFIKQ